MGCVSVGHTSVRSLRAVQRRQCLQKIQSCWAELEKKQGKEEEEAAVAPSSDLGESNHLESLSFRLGNLHNYVEGEHVAAGWPPPSKEIDAKNREEGRRKKTTCGRVRRPDTATKPSRRSLGINKLAPSEDLSALYLREQLVAAKKSRSHLGYDKKSEQVEFSGPLLSQKDRVDEFLEKHEQHIRQATRKS